jgi:hypothetical protein
MHDRLRYFGLALAFLNQAYDAPADKALIFSKPLASLA